MKQSDMRREVAYYASLGYLAAVDTGKDCSSMDEIRELGLKDPDRLVRTLIDLGKLEECPLHEGRYRMTYAWMKKLGLE